MEMATNQVDGQLVTDIQDGYAGVRTEDGVIVVAIHDGQQKPLRHIVRHSPDGFEWGYGGSGPADLALSILLDALNSKEAHMINYSLYQDFKRDFVAGWGDRWELRRDEIDAWIDRRGS